LKNGKERENYYKKLAVKNELRESGSGLNLSGQNKLEGRWSHNELIACAKIEIGPIHLETQSPTFMFCSFKHIVIIKSPILLENHVEPYYTTIHLFISYNFFFFYYLQYLV
jgi:hypothetical protein